MKNKIIGLIMLTVSLMVSIACLYLVSVCALYFLSSLDGKTLHIIISDWRDVIRFILGLFTMMFGYLVVVYFVFIPLASESMYKIDKTLYR